MNPHRNDITGIILAGGKSSRMGKDKGLMLLNGKAMIEYAIAQLIQHTGQIVIISNDLSYKQFGWPVIADIIKGIGPAGGILTGLSYSHTELNLVASCDMPFITREAISCVKNKVDRSEIIVPVLNGRMEPLLGIYSKSCTVKLKQLISEGEYRLHKLITNFDHKCVCLDDILKGNETVFFNVNSPGDFNAAIDFGHTTKP